MWIRPSSSNQSKYTPCLEYSYPMTMGNKIEWTNTLSTWNIKAEITIKLLSPCLTIDEDSSQQEMRETIEARAWCWGRMVLHSRKCDGLCLNCRRCHDWDSSSRSCLQSSKFSSLGSRSRRKFSSLDSASRSWLHSSKFSGLNSGSGSRRKSSGLDSASWSWLYNSNFSSLVTNHINECLCIIMRQRQWWQQFQYSIWNIYELAKHLSQWQTKMHQDCLEHCHWMGWCWWWPLWGSKMSEM